MTQFYRFTRCLWQNGPVRWLLTITLAAFFGIAAGRTVLGSLGSISVVDGSSMVPTYQPGARVYSAPISTPIERGDIVLVNDGHKDFALKRIVGMPGETVHICRGYIFINRKLLREPYLPKYTYTFPDEHCGRCAFKLGQGQYFVLGDNRTCSTDSRVYGPLEEGCIKSRVPTPANMVRGQFANYTLPDEGKRAIRAL